MVSLSFRVLPDRFPENRPGLLNGGKGDGIIGIVYQFHDSLSEVDFGQSFGVLDVTGTGLFENFGEGNHLFSLNAFDASLYELGGNRLLDGFDQQGSDQIFGILISKNDKFVKEEFVGLL